MVMLLLMVWLVGPLGSAAARQQGELPDATAIVARYVEAIGGEDVVRSQESRHASGRFEMPSQGLGGTLDIWAATPDRLLIRIDIAGLGESKTGYNGEVGWSIDPIMGPRVLEGKELAQLREEADFHADLHESDDIVAIETVEQTTFKEQPVYKVRIERRSGREYFEYFSVDSGLIVGVEGPQDSVMGTINVVSTLEDYRQFGPVLGPSRVVQEFGSGQRAVSIIESVDFDSVSPSMFELPEQIKALTGR